MKKVLIVDDEPIVSLAIKSLVDWENNGYIMDYEAFDGEQALQIIKENPDIEIVITDINMPIMDGLELIKEINNLQSKPQIIVLSAYDDFNLVRQAFKLGALDYILKAEMNPESILKTIKNIPDKNTHLVLKPNENLAFYKEKVLKDLIWQEELYDIKKRASECKLRLDEKNIVACFLWVDDYDKIQERYESENIKNFVSSVLNSIYGVLNRNEIGEAISLSPQEYVILLSFKKSGDYEIHNRINTILHDVKKSLIDYVNINVSIGVSNSKSGYAKCEELYKQAEANVRLRFIFGKNKIIFPHEASHVISAESESIIGKEDSFIAALMELDQKRSVEELDRLLGTIKGESIKNIHIHYMELIFLIIKAINDLGEDVVDVFGKDIDFYNKINKFETKEELQIWVKNIVNWILNYLKEKKDAKINRSIARAIEFIKQNYQEDISLKLISEYVGLSETYFSKVFAKKMGESFINYLTRVRIEKAKDYIKNTNMKIYEISEKVGYTNVEHFSRVFKRFTGQSPNRFNS